MPIFKVVTDQDIGKGLYIDGGKLNAYGFKNLTVDGNQIVLVGMDDQESRVNLPAQTVDVKLNGATLENDTTLRLTLSDGSHIDVDLAKFLNVNTDTKPTAFSWDGKNLKLTLSDQTEVIADFATFITNEVKGNELQSLAGVSLGYLVK